MIRIVNLKNYKLNEGEVLFKVDRTSPVGNPFFMKDESMRNEVCDKYKEYFHKQTAKTNKRFMDTIWELYCLAKDNDVALGCWCYPKRCHAETIKIFLDKAIAKRMV